MYPSSHHPPTLLPLPQLLIPTTYPNTATHLPITYTSPSIPPQPDDKTYGQLLAEHEADAAKATRLREARRLREGRVRAGEERRLREAEERRVKEVTRKVERQREEKEKRRVERHERREHRLQEEKDRLKRKHVPRPGKDEPKEAEVEKESKQQLSTDDRWSELVRELSGSKEERRERKRRQEETRMSLWSRKGDEVADGAAEAEAVTESDTDSTSSLAARPMQLHDIASSSSSDAFGSQVPFAKHSGRKAVWTHPAEQAAMPDSPLRRRRRGHQPAASPHSVFADDSASHRHAHGSCSHTAEPALLWSQPTPPRTPRPSSHHHPSDSLWSTPQPQLHLHTRSQSTTITPPYYTPQPNQPYTVASSHVRLLELPTSLLYSTPAECEVVRPLFVPLRSAGTAIELSSEEEEDGEDEDGVGEEVGGEPVMGGRVRGKRGTGSGVRERWVNLFDEERLAVFSNLSNDIPSAPSNNAAQQQPSTHQPHPGTARTQNAALSNAAPEAAVDVEDAELQDDELLQRARELNYHALLLKKKRASRTPVFSSLPGTPNANDRQLAVSSAVEHKVEAEMAKLRSQINQQAHTTPHSAAGPAQPAYAPSAQPTLYLASQQLTSYEPLKDERPRVRSMEQQRLSDKLAAIEQKLAESPPPPPPPRRTDSAGLEDDEWRRRQQFDQLQQRQEAEARNLTQRLHTILLSPPSAASTPRTAITPPIIPLVSVHPALKPVPLPPQAKEKLALLKGKHGQHEQQQRQRGGSTSGGKVGKGGVGLEEDELYEEAQALIRAFRSEFGGAMKAHTQNL